MKCPNCGSRTAVALDLHSDGFSKEENPLKECDKCGLVWRIKAVGDTNEVDIIKPADK